MVLDRLTREKHMKLFSMFYMRREPSLENEKPKKWLNLNVLIKVSYLLVTFPQILINFMLKNTNKS